MDPKEFTDPNNRVWRYDQVLTREDLLTFYDNLGEVYDTTPPELDVERDRLMIALRTVDTLINWIDYGKDNDLFFRL